MKSYIIHIEFSFINQLNKLQSELMSTLHQDICSIAARFGGLNLNQFTFEFSSILGEPTRNTAEAAWAIQNRVRENSRNLSGTSVFILPQSSPYLDSADDINRLIARTNEDYGIWLTPEINLDFTPLFDLSEIEGLFRADAPERT